MLSRFRVIIVVRGLCCLLCWCAVGSLEAGSVQVQLTCRSLQIATSTFTSPLPAGGNVTAYFTTYNPARVPRVDLDGNLAYVSQELRPRAGSPGEYEADYLFVRSETEFEYGSLQLRFPGVDTDVDGVPDELEIEGSVAYRLLGTASADLPAGATYALDGTWSRGQRQFGAGYFYYLTQNGGGSGRTFVVTRINLVATDPVHSRATYGHAPGQILRFEITLRAGDDTEATASFDVPYTVIDNDTLELPAFTFVDSDRMTYQVRAATLHRKGTAYHGNLRFEDGDPSTSWTDYADWHIELVDHADRNGNGVPDLTDLTPVIVTAPASLTAVEGGAVSLSVAATGRGPLEYQWFHNDIAVPGANAAVLVLDAITAAQQGNYTVVVSNGSGAATSDVARVSVVQAGPLFQRQPDGGVVPVGGNLILSASAAGAIRYQWFHNNLPILGATNAEYAIIGGQPWLAGTYRATAESQAGISSSSGAYVTVGGRTYVAQSFATAPLAGYVEEGALILRNGATFKVGAFPPAVNARVRFRFSGSVADEMTMWLRSNGRVGFDGRVNIGISVSLRPGAESGNIRLWDSTGAETVAATRTIATHTWYEVAIEDDGSFMRVLLDGESVLEKRTTARPGPFFIIQNQPWSHPIGSNESDRVVAVDYVFVGGLEPAVATAAKPRLANISTRGYAGTGDKVMITGFVASGTEPQSLLIRAAGPALGAFAIPNPLADPQITLFADNTAIAANDDWPATLADEMERIGAFPFVVGSKDAALAGSYAPGLYTVTVSGVNGQTGPALAEVYDTGDGSAAVRVVNLSTRGLVGPGRELIAGLVVSGTTAKKVLVRAVGPTLKNFGLNDALSDPILRVCGAESVRLWENDDWGTQATVAEIERAVKATQAFAFTSRLSKDAAILVYLPPGAYSFVVSAKDGDSGIAMIEAYEVD
jgi:hypothetical protein